MTRGVFRILAPQINVNDDTIDFLEWKVENGSYVKKGQLICEVETVKSLIEVTAEREGVIHQMVLPNSIVKVGECFGIIGDDRDAIEKYFLQEQTDGQVSGDSTKGRIKATAKAQALADQHGVKVEQIVEVGVKGTIKESDVARYLSQKGQMGGDEKLSYGTKAQRDDAQLPPDMLIHLIKEDTLPRHKMFMAEKLRNSLRNKLVAVITAEIELGAIKKYIQLHKNKGQLISILPIVMYALGRTLPRFPDFTRFQFDGQVFRYREINVAFIVKTFDGLLYAPVIHRVDKMDIEQIARECRSITLRANRRQLKPEEMDGACFTVSCIPRNAITYFTALIDQFQSAIIAVSGEYSALDLNNGEVVRIPKTSLTLSYDHAIVDGWDSAVFLEHLNKEIYQAVSGN